GGSLRRIAFAVGAGDDQQVLLLLQAAYLVVGHVEELNGDALRPGRVRERPGEAGAVSSLASEQDAERPRGRCRRPRRHWRRPPAGADDSLSGAAGRVPGAGEEAADPDRLLRREVGGERIDAMPLVSRKAGASELRFRHCILVLWPRGIAVR